MFRLDLLCDTLGHLSLLRRRREDRATVLCGKHLSTPDNRDKLLALTRADIASLAIDRRRVVRAIKELDQLAIGYDLGIEFDAHGLCVLGLAAAHGAVVRVDRVGGAARVPYARGNDSLCGREVLDEDVFGAPEAAGGEDGDFGGAYNKD